MNNPFETINERLCRIEEAIVAMKDRQGNEASTQSSKDLLSVKEAARFLNLTVPTIYTKVSQRELPFMKQGKRLYFSKEELFDYVKKGRKKTNSEIEAEATQCLVASKRRSNQPLLKGI